MISSPNAAVHADAIQTLSGWTPDDPGQQALRQAFLGFLAARPDACARSCVPGHLTASAVVVSHDGMREATEESGIGALEIDPRPLHLDVHPITCSLGVPTRHFDVRFLLHAPPGATPVISSESVDLAWWPTHSLPPDVALLIPAMETYRAL
ncbi:MAG: NUDIX hydrolase [Actinomycetota bacterium]|nr:NUDIX hydrolase [Actinomycetota bacterium]